jgi:Holliday junction resolvasome, endonuclease subunit
MMMVMHLLKLTSKPQIDASDALAIALCHAHTRSSLLPHGLGRRAAVADACVCESRFLT